MLTKESDASVLGALVDGCRPVELIPELVRQGLITLIELEVGAVLDAERYERSEKHLGHRYSYRHRLLTSEAGGPTYGSTGCTASASIIRLC
jgi:hypothetical protein